MTAAMAFLGSAILAALPAAPAEVIVNNCDDAKQWHGASRETTLVKEGTGAVGWVPSRSVELSTRVIAHDWSGGNCLRFWMHSAQATGSRLTLVLPSADPARKGSNYFALGLRVDWQGWREIIAPLKEIGAVRHPVGWQKIDSFRLHAAWDPSVKVNPDDAFVIDDIRVVRLSRAGTLMSDKELFAALELARPGLERVRAAAQAGDFAAAKGALRDYFLARRSVKWTANWWERPPLPARRPRTAAADDALKHVLHFNGKTYQLGAKVDWASNQENRGESATVEWNAVLNRHFFLHDLAAAYWGTGEERYAAEIVALARDWIADSPPLMLSSGNSPYHYAWETLNTAIRAADSWPDALFRTADAPAWTAEAFCTVVKSLVHHARHLMRWPSRGNWLTEESKAIATVGILFPEFSEAQTWRRTGIARLYEQMEQEVYPDGIENELALGYGLWVLTNYAAVLELAALNDRRAEIPADYQSRLERMYNYVLYAMAPDGQVHGLNDSGAANPQAILKQGFAYFPKRQDFLWGATRGAQGRMPEQVSYAFPYAGHYALRSGWQRDARLLFLDAGPFGSGHQHEDKLTFFLDAHGRSWITEGGTYMYDASRWRRYVLSTRAHNTVRVDGQDQNRRIVRDSYVLPYPFQPLPNPWISRPDFDYVAGVYDDGYGPQGAIRARHRREIVFVKPDYWVIVDTLDPAGDAVHDWETIFHVNAGQSELQGTHLWAVADGKRLDIFGCGPDLTVKVVKGLKEEPVQGWGPGCKQAIPTALFHNRRPGRTRNAYVLFPTAPPDSAPQVQSLLEPAAAGDILLRITMPDGRVHYFARRGSDQRGTGLAEIGPLTTDAAACIVKLDRDDKVIGAFAVEGTTVKYHTQRTSATR
jgi:hypothetical protein